MLLILVIINYLDSFNGDGQNCWQKQTNKVTVNKLLFTQIIMSHSNRYKALIFSTWREVIMPVWPCSTAIGWVDFKDHTRITCKRGQANELQCITNNNRRTQNYMVMNCPLKPGFHNYVANIRDWVLCTVSYT